MLSNGSYVRLVLSPTITGTIHEEIYHLGKAQFVFQKVERYAEKMDDIFIYDGDAEECARPTDAQVDAINKILATNPPR